MTGVKTKIAPSFANTKLTKEVKILKSKKNEKDEIFLKAIKEAKCAKKPSLSKLMLKGMSASKATVLSVTMLKTKIISSKLSKDKIYAKKAKSTELNQIGKEKGRMYIKSIQAIKSK